MSHNQDVKLVLWCERGEALGEMMKKLRDSSVVLSSQETNQSSTKSDHETQKNTALTEQPA